MDQKKILEGKIVAIVSHDETAIKFLSDLVKQNGGKAHAVRNNQGDLYANSYVFDETSMKGTPEVMQIAQNLVARQVVMKDLLFCKPEELYVNLGDFLQQIAAHSRSYL